MPGNYISLGDQNEIGSRQSVFVAGDLMLDSGRRNDNDPLLTQGLRNRVESAEHAAVNLEAPVRAESGNTILKSGPLLENDPAAPHRLADAGFDLATLANNHAMDYGWASLQKTIENCTDAGLVTCGAGPNRSAAMQPVTQRVGDAEVAFLGVCEREFGVARDQAPGTAWAGHRDVIHVIREAASTADTVVVFAHGGVEYVPFPPPERRERLKEFIDHGADIVVAHHPHVPQGWEEYRDGAILHSLGNFLFDSQADDPATSWGLCVELEFAGGELIGLRLVPTVVIDDVVHELGKSTAADTGPGGDRSDHLAYLHRLAAITAEDLQPYWQAVAVHKHTETYSSWLLTGVGDNQTRAKAAPYDSAAHAPLWNPKRRREELLILLNILRYESHRRVMTDALAVLTGETVDRRTPEIETEVEELLAWTERS